MARNILVVGELVEGALSPTTAAASAQYNSQAAPTAELGGSRSAPTASDSRKSRRRNASTLSVISASLRGGNLDQGNRSAPIDLDQRAPARLFA